MKKDVTSTISPKALSLKCLLIIVFMSAGKLGLCQSPRFSFFTELPADELKSLFADSSVISNLRTLNASVRMGLIDFTPGRAEVVRALNKQNIPVVGWLLLPEDEGYWFNMENADAAAIRYEQFKKWSQENDLRWTGIGIDLEANIDDIKLMTTDFPAALWLAYRRLFSSSRLEKAQSDYQQVLSQIQGDHYEVESYILPFMLDERAAATTSFQKATGMLDLPATTEIPMAYSSFFGPNGAAFIPVYGKGLKALAIGSTGGGVKIEGMKATPPTLSWEDLERDLLLASKVVSEVHIFSLEGCVEKGYLPRLKEINYNQPAPDISSNIAELEQTRTKVQRILNVLDHPVLLTTGAIVVVIGLTVLIAWLVVALIRLVKRFALNRSKITDIQP
ncbi:MAG: hypothetical protein QM762_13515 [Chryseolinea sp.]